jgi:hypothetical protein
MKKTPTCADKNNPRLDNILQTQKKIFFGFCILMLGCVLAFAQTPPPANLLLWLKTDTGVAVSGGVVQTWTNQSGSVDDRNVYLQQGSPTLVSQPFPNGSHPSVVFDGFAGLTNGTGAQNLVVASNQVSVYVVGGVDDNTQPSEEFVSLWPGFAFGIDDGVGGEIKWYLNGPSPPELPSTVILGNGDQHVITGTFAVGGQRNLYIDGSLNNSDTPTLGPIVYDTPYILGIGTLSGYFGQNLIGRISEVLMYSTVDASQRSAVEAYLQNKYFLHAGPVSITTPPQAQTVTEPTPVTFNVTVDGTAPFTYQWLSNSIPLPGATNASYSIKFTRTFDSGNYSVQVANSFGPITSAPALLTVNQHTNQPKILSATRLASDPRHVTLAFDLPLTSSSVSNVSHYLFSNGAHVVTATLDTNLMTVQLKVTASIQYSNTIITVNGVQSIYGINTSNATASIILPYFIPTGFGATTNGAVVNLNGPGLDPHWQFGLVNAGLLTSNYAAQIFVQSNGVMHCHSDGTNIDLNFLVYVDPAYSNSITEEILMHLTILAVDSFYGSIAGCGAGVLPDPTSSVSYRKGGTGIRSVGANYAGAPFNYPFFCPVSDFVADEVPTNGQAWVVGGSYWIRLRNDIDASAPDTGVICSSRAWVGDGSTPEPAYWDRVFKDPSGHTRNGFAGIRAGFGTGNYCDFDVDYIQITSPGLPTVTPKLPASLIPRITVDQTISGGNMILSWPANAPVSYTLQSSASLSGPWVNVGAPVVINGAANTVTQPLTTHFMLYRLIQ